MTRGGTIKNRLRIAGKEVSVAKLDAGASSIQRTLIPNPPIDPADISRLIQSDRSFKLAVPDKLT